MCERDPSVRVLKSPQHNPYHRSSDGPRKSSRGSFRCRIAAPVCCCTFCGILASGSRPRDDSALSDGIVHTGFPDDHDKREVNLNK